MQRHTSLPTSKLVLRLFTSNSSPPRFLHAYSLWVVGCSDQSEKQRSASHCANTIQQQLKCYVINTTFVINPKHSTIHAAMKKLTPVHPDPVETKICLIFSLFIQQNLQTQGAFFHFQQPILTLQMFQRKSKKILTQDSKVIVICKFHIHKNKS